MTELPVSIIVVSRGRPDALERCLIGLSQLQYDPFEIIIVADPAGIAISEALSFSSRLKLIAFDQPNISAARNMGLSQAAGEVVAFIDDDAVPEPQWLRHLVAPAAQSDVAAMGGYVRGRNGISFQYKARSLDPFGEPQELDLDPLRPTLLTPPKGRAIKTEGTNMAFRRNILVDLGGFDTAFHYFLDETDLNMRLARAGHATAIVPLAEVHHGFAANPTRTATRVPRDLFDIGASWAVFQRKHMAQAERAAHWKRLRDDQRRRLLTHLVQGGLEPRDVRRLMRRLDAGYKEGLARALGPAKLAAHPSRPFSAFEAQSRPSIMMPTRPLRASKDRAKAAQRVKDGETVTLLNLSRTTMFHHVTFGRDGVWIQTGGIYGKSERDQPIVAVTTRRRRIEKERTRVARQRGFSDD